MHFCPVKDFVERVYNFSPNPPNLMVLTIHTEGKILEPK